jgi:hypothetical protein
VLEAAIHPARRRRGAPHPQAACPSLPVRGAPLNLYREALTGFVDSSDEAEWLREDDREVLGRVRELLPALGELSEQALRAALEPVPRAN